MFLYLPKSGQDLLLANYVVPATGYVTDTRKFPLDAYIGGPLKFFTNGQEEDYDWLEPNPPLCCPGGGGGGGTGTYFTMRRVRKTATVTGENTVELGAAPNGAPIQVFINGVLHAFESDYEVVGLNLNLFIGAGVTAGDEIIVLFYV
jgi:hypothetical protein